MYRNEHNILLYNNPISDKELNKLLSVSEQPKQFCNAHELVMRNHISRNSKKIWKNTRTAQLNTFYFLINKN